MFIPGLHVQVFKKVGKRFNSTRDSFKIPGRATSSGNGEITYTIKSNDTLYEIALKYNVSYRDIMQWNEIRNHRTIRPGQKIVIKTKG